MNAILDFDILAGLKELSPEDPMAFLNELVDAYLQQANDDVLAIEKNSKANNWQGVSKSAHRLKSASRQIGSLRVGELAEKIELMTRDTTPDETIHPHVLTLLETYPESVRLIQDYLKKN